jgi:hypothetical protein
MDLQVEDQKIINMWLCARNIKSLMTWQVSLFLTHNVHPLFILNRDEKRKHVEYRIFLQYERICWFATSKYFLNSWSWESTIMSLFAVTDVTTTALQLLSLVSLVRSLNQCTTRLPFDPIHGQMYTWSVYAVISNIGPQKCVSECISRKPYCQGVNYSRNHLCCEICSSTEHSIPSEEYMTVDLGEVICFTYKNTYRTMLFWLPKLWNAI